MQNLLAAIERSFLATNVAARQRVIEHNSFTALHDATVKSCTDNWAERADT